MANSSDESAKNRYHTFQSYKAHVKAASIQPGITPEFVHELLVRVDSLIQTLEKTVNRPGSPPGSHVQPILKESNKAGITTLKDCATRVDAQLRENPNVSPKM